MKESAIIGLLISNVLVFSLAKSKISFTESKLNLQTTKTLECFDRLSVSKATTRALTECVISEEEEDCSLDLFREVE